MTSEKISHLTEIILTLADHEVDFIICGGVALVIHGIERMTMDLDLSVNMNESNLKKFLSAMDELGLVPRAPVPADSILDPQKRKMMVDEKNAMVFTFIDNKSPYRQVDIFITDKLSFEKLNKSVDMVRIKDYNAKLVSRETLLEMKKAVNPPREKDLFDIHFLEKMIEKSRE